MVSDLFDLSVSLILLIFWVIVNSYLILDIKTMFLAAILYHRWILNIVESFHLLFLRRMKKYGLQILLVKASLIPMWAMKLVNKDRFVFFMNLNAYFIKYLPSKWDWNSYPLILQENRDNDNMMELSYSAIAKLDQAKQNEIQPSS